MLPPTPPTFFVYLESSKNGTPTLFTIPYLYHLINRNKTYMCWCNLFLLER